MHTKTITQPKIQLGRQIEDLLNTDVIYSRIVFVSAFTALRTILRLRERLLFYAGKGTIVRFVIGIDLGGTSEDVLRELASWNCEVYIYHNPIVRATFHPKIYLFQADSFASLFIGSNNLTDGGMFTNYEAATHYTFTLPEDDQEFIAILNPLSLFIEPDGPTVRRLDEDLIDVLTQKGMLPTEKAARNNRRICKMPMESIPEQVPHNPFSAVRVPMAPLLPKELRSVQNSHLEENNQPEEEVSPPGDEIRPVGVLVWRKTLPRTDALQVRPGSHHVGGVRLTQARFENPPGQRIDQTTYFRMLFDDYDWEPEPGGHHDQEHTFVPMRIFIRGTDFGVRNFEISHKPSGEAGQDNYTTILRWGRNFNEIIKKENLTGAVFSLYEITDADVRFLIDITDA